MDKKILVVIGILMLALVAIPAALFAFNVFDIRSIFSEANVEVAPSGVNVTNLTANLITVTWTTPDTLTKGYVHYKQKNNGSMQIAYDDRAGGDENKTFETHHVSLENLLPDTEYEFSIVVNGKEYKNSSGAYFTAKTTNVSAVETVPISLIGILSGTGVGNDGIIYLYLENSASDKSVVYSSPIQNEGTFSISVGGIRNTNVESAFNIGDDTKINLYGVGKGSLVYKGQKDWNEDLGTLQMSNESATPNFPIPNYTSQAESATLEITNIGDGAVLESVSTIEGTANADESLVVSITGPTEEEGSVTADNSGSFSYNLEDTLDPGSYIIDVSSNDRDSSDTISITVAQRYDDGGLGGDNNDTGSNYGGVVRNTGLDISSLVDNGSVSTLTSVSGTADAYEDLNLVISSSSTDVVDATFSADSDGDFSYSITSNIPAGNYSVILASLDRDEEVSIDITVLGASDDNNLPSTGIEDNILILAGLIISLLSVSYVYIMKKIPT